MVCPVVYQNAVKGGVQTDPDSSESVHRYAFMRRIADRANTIPWTVADRRQARSFVAPWRVFEVQLTLICRTLVVQRIGARRVLIG